MRWLAALLVLVPLLVGCGGESSAAEASARRAQQRHDRTERSEAAALQPPKVTRHRLEAGELLVLDVPVVLQFGILDSAKCFIWRDIEFKTASIACPSGVEGPVPGEAGPERER